jgi:hypothetical protein
MISDERALEDACVAGDDEMDKAKAAAMKPGVAKVVKRVSVAARHAGVACIWRGLFA